MVRVLVYDVRAEPRAQFFNVSVDGEVDTTRSASRGLHTAKVERAFVHSFMTFSPRIREMTGNMRRGSIHIDAYGCILYKRLHRARFAPAKGGEIRPSELAQVLRAIHA